MEDLVNKKEVVNFTLQSKDLERLFVDAAKKVFDYVVDLGSIDENEIYFFMSDSDDIESLFADWLNDLVNKMNYENMLYCSFECEVFNKQNRWYLKASAKGEKFNPEKHKIKNKINSLSYKNVKYANKLGHKIDFSLEV